MLLNFRSYSGLDTRRLMDLYAEGNKENADYFHPDMEDRAEAVRLIEEDFLDFLKNDFFTKAGNEYWILEENGAWLSALRTSELDGRAFYIEALETHPGFRRKGYAAKLIDGVIEELKKGGSFRLCSCVDKENAPSIATHLHCGFKITAETGNDLLSNERRDWEYSFEYSWKE